MHVTDIHRPAPPTCCISASQASTSINTDQQQYAWPNVPLCNSQARHQAFTEHDTSIAWVLDDDFARPAADSAKPVCAVPHTDNALHSSHYLAQSRQLVQTPCNQLCYLGNSGDRSESKRMPAASASLQAVHHQHSPYAAPSLLLHHQNPAAHQIQPLACFLPPLITKNSAHADNIHTFSHNDRQAPGYKQGDMLTCSDTSQECLTKTLQQPVNTFTSQLTKAHENYTQHDALQTPQPATTIHSSQPWSAITEGKDNAAVPVFHQAAVPSSGSLNLQAAAMFTAWQNSSHGITDRLPATATAAASAGASAETAATPTTIKAPLQGLATSSQACCDGQQHLNGSSRSPAKPAEVTAGVPVWKQKKNVVCLVNIAGLLMYPCCSPTCNCLLAVMHCPELSTLSLSSCWDSLLLFFA